MSDPTKFPQMHIAESVFNRIMNMKAELLPLTNLTLPQMQDSGPSGQQIGDLANTMQDTSVTPSLPGAGEPAVEGAALDEQLAAGGAAGAAPATAGADLAAASAAGGGAALGAGTVGAGAGAAGAAVAGEAVATGAELLPLLALA